LMGQVLGGERTGGVFWVNILMGYVLCGKGAPVAGCRGVSLRCG